MATKIEQRADQQAQWLDENAPYILVDQKHLDGGTPERAYWNYGYMIALRDVSKMMREQTTK